MKTANTLCGLFFRLNKKWKLKDSVPFSDSESGRSGYKQTLILSIGYSRPPWLRLSASRKRDYCKTNSDNQQHTQPTTHIISIYYFLSAMFFLIPKLVALNRLVWTLDLQHLALWEAITRSPRLWSTGAWIQWASSLHHFHWPGGSQRGGFRDDNLPALSSSIGYFRLIYAVLNCIKWINIDQKKL